MSWHISAGDAQIATKPNAVRRIKGHLEDPGMQSRRVAVAGKASSDIQENLQTEQGRRWQAMKKSGSSVGVAGKAT